MLGVVCCNSFSMTHPFARLPGRLRLTAAALAGACLIAPYSPSQESTDVAPIIPFPTADSDAAERPQRHRRADAERRPRRVLVDRAHGLARRVRARPLGLRAFLRAHDVPRHGALPVRRLQPHHHDDRRGRERLYDRRPHGVSLVDGGRGSRASHGARERSVPTAVVRRGRVPDRGRRRLRRVSQDAHGARVRALRGARRHRVRASSVRPHDARLRARHRDHADAVRVFAGPSSAATTAPTTSCCSSPAT